MPGVQVLTQTQVGPSTAPRATSGQFFLVGLTERGSSTKPILVRGMADVAAHLGARVSYGVVWEALKEFFDEGGQQAYVSRLVGPAASVGTLTLVDRAGSPVATLRIDAASGGAWSTQMEIVVLNGSVANTFRIQVYLNGQLVEQKTNLATPAAAVAAFSESEFIRCTDLGSGTSAPNNNPIALAATPLSAGTDDRASLTVGSYVTGLERFTKGYGDGCVAIPGQVHNTVWLGIQAHCEANRRIGLLSAAQSASKGDLLTRAAEVDSAWCGLFAPWIDVSDGAGGVRTISPESYVAAARARAHDAVGPWQVPAGKRSQSRAIIDLDVTFSEDDANDLDAGAVSIIRKIANTFRLYGWRSLSTDVDNYFYLKDRDLLNYLVVQSEKVLEDYVWETIDRKGHLLSNVNAAIVGLVDPIAKANGLYPFIDSDGNVIDPGYKVDTGPAVNTSASLATNTVRVVLSVRISPTGAIISLTIVKVGLTSGM